MKLTPKDIKDLKVLIAELASGVTSVHKGRDHKRMPRGKFPWYAWFSQPIYTETIYDEDCKGCRSVKAFHYIKQLLKMPKITKEKK